MKPILAGVLSDFWISKKFRPTVEAGFFERRSKGRKHWRFPPPLRRVNFPGLTVLESWIGQEALENPLTCVNFPG
jgi:hypothetical protein